MNQAGGGEWDPRLLVRNTATDISLKQYLKAVDMVLFNNCA